MLTATYVHVLVGTVPVEAATLAVFRRSRLSFPLESLNWGSPLPPPLYISPAADAVLIHAEYVNGGIISRMPLVPLPADPHAVPPQAAFDVPPNNPAPSIRPVVAVTLAATPLQPFALKSTLESVPAESTLYGATRKVFESYADPAAPP